MDKVFDTDYLNKIYEVNSFIKLLDMRVVTARPGMTTLLMPVDPAKHTNLYGIAHGGALASLADSAMGMACATLGKRVMTLDMNINFIRGAKPLGNGVTCVGEVLHNGRQTMVTEAKIYDDDKQLLSVARATFIVIGQFEKQEEGKKE